MITDIHCHFDDASFEHDRNEVVMRAKENKVVKIITCGIDYITNEKTLMLAKKYDIVVPALGRYPYDALENDGHYERNKDAIRTTVEEDIKYITKHKNEIVAIGECGLDLHHGKDITKQIEEFKQMIELAIKLKKPIIIHSRKAEKETLEVLNTYKGKIEPKKVILHCFSGKKKLVEEAIVQKYMLSIPPSVIRSEQFKEMAHKTPLKQLLTETDSPFLSPYKNEDGTPVRNEPAFVIESVKAIAEIKKLTYEECVNQLYMNFQKVF
ncbi:MAG: TatD family hydrolase [Candidatus Woesearchaeota archaeon]